MRCYLSGVTDMATVLVFVSGSLEGIVTYPPDMFVLTDTATPAPHKCCSSHDID